MTTINSDGTLGTWTTTTSLPTPLINSQAIVTKSRVYLLGGHTSSNTTSAVFTARINLDGTLGTWTVANSLPGALDSSQAIVTTSRVYLLGGYNGSAYTPVVYTAPINSDGTLGAWTTGTSLPGNLCYTQPVMTKSRVFLLGGNVGNGYVSTVYTAPINSDGTLGAWSTGTSLPGALGTSQAIVTKSRVYLLGGYSSGATTTVYTAPFADGWSITSNDYYVQPTTTQFAHNLATYNGTAQTPQSAFASTDMEPNVTISYDQTTPGLTFRAVQRKIVAPVISGYRYLTTRLNKGS
jgi:N-acetylneuraminic acid mutarotase